MGHLCAAALLLLAVVDFQVKMSNKDNKFPLLLPEFNFLLSFRIFFSSYASEIQFNHFVSPSTRVSCPNDASAFILKGNSCCSLAALYLNLDVVNLTSDELNLNVTTEQTFVKKLGWTQKVKGQRDFPAAELSFNRISRQLKVVPLRILRPAGVKTFGSDPGDSFWS